MQISGEGWLPRHPRPSPRNGAKSSLQIAYACTSNASYSFYLAYALKSSIHRTCVEGPASLVTPCQLLGRAPAILRSE
jgi:hypothetical protein